VKLMGTDTGFRPGLPATLVVSSQSE